MLLRLHFSEAALSRQDIEHKHAFVPLQNMNEVVLKKESTSLDHVEFDMDAEVSEVVITLSDNMRLVANHKDYTLLSGFGEDYARSRPNRGLHGIATQSFGCFRHCYHVCHGKVANPP